MVAAPSYQNIEEKGCGRDKTKYKYEQIQQQKLMLAYVFLGESRSRGWL